MTTKYFEILLPVKTNAGEPYDTAHGKFVPKAIEIAGGLTEHGIVKGYWKDDKGKLVAEPMVRYTVATDNAKFEDIVLVAHILFADQQAIFRAEIGLATID